MSRNTVLTGSSEKRLQPSPNARPEPSERPALPSILALPLPVEIKATLIEFFLSLGANPGFVGYPTLAAASRECLLTADRIGLPAAAFRRPYLDALEELLGLLKTHRSMADTLSGVGIAGPASSYPIIRALLADILPNYREPMLQLRALLVSTAMMYRDAETPPAVISAAKEIRLSLSAGDLRRDVLSDIPELRVDRLALGQLAWTCESLCARRWTPQQRAFLKAVSSLARLCIEVSLTVETQALKVLRTPPDEDVDAMAGGSLSQVIEPANAVGELPEDADDADDDHYWTFTERPKEDRVSVQGLAAEARGSRFWLAAAFRGLSWDRSVLSPVQRQAVLASLAVQVGTVETSPERWSAVLLGVILATGLDLQEIADLEVGEGRDLDPVAGVYRRRPPAISEATVCSPEMAARRLPPGTVIELPLPDVVRSLLQIAATGPLGTWFAEQDPLWKTTFTDHLASLRGVESLRITPLRIGKLLAQRLQQQHGDPAITYLLVGLRSQAMPIDLRYAAIPASRLRVAYREAIDSLFRFVPAA